MTEQTIESTGKKGRYRKVEVRMWGDEKFMKLSPIPPCGQGLWLFLLTGAHTGSIPGLFKAGRAAMAEELGWELEAFDKAFREASDQGLVKADWKAKVVWIPNAIRYNKPENPNVVTSWGDQWDLIPECDLKREACEYLKANIANMSEGFIKAFDKVISKDLLKPLPKTMANQEQEQEQDNKKNMSGSSDPDVDALKKLEAEKLHKQQLAQAKEIFDYWMLKLNKAKTTKYTDERRNKILTRLKGGYTVEQCKQAIDGCASSEYHTSNGHTGIELIFRNGSKLEEFIEKLSLPTTAPMGGQGQQRGNQQNRQYSADQIPAIESRAYKPFEFKDEPLPESTPESRAEVERARQAALDALGSES